MAQRYKTTTKRTPLRRKTKGKCPSGYHKGKTKKTTGSCVRTQKKKS